VPEAKWLTARRIELLRVPYFHNVFIVMHELVFPSSRPSTARHRDRLPRSPNAPISAASPAAKSRLSSGTWHRIAIPHGSPQAACSLDGHDGDRYNPHRRAEFRLIHRSAV
jgi:hypothetical protein